MDNTTASGKLGRASLPLPATVAGDGDGQSGHLVAPKGHPVRIPAVGI
jgi:hypothetical protein